MRILIDTNVLIDFILNRQPYADRAEQIIYMCKNKVVDGCVAAHSLTNLFYILRKEISFEERKSFLYYLSEITEIIGVDKQKILSALDNDDFSDFEDSVQTECAKSFSSDYIITRNIKDFQNSSIKPVTPDDFLKLVER